MALGVHSKASNHAVKGELGRFPLPLFLLFTPEFLSTSYGYLPYKMTQF